VARRRCTHKTRLDFTQGRDEQGRQIWRCSNCGKLGVWTDSWGYWGNLECRRCETAEIERVWCSDECKERLEQRGNSEVP
jgi:hypothetical protein